MRHKVLILPGGGVFGMVTAQLMCGYAKDACVQDLVRVVGGTSVGGILALLYGRGMEFGLVRDVMREAIPRIFASSWYNLWGVFGPLHDANVMEVFLKEHLSLPFGDLTPAIVIPSIDFKNRTVKVFDNITRKDDVTIPSWHIARATSAAPTYFKPFDCQNTAYIDGGLFENIPLMTTIMAVKSKMGITPERLDVFVVGTGEFPGGAIPSQMAGWGLKSWAGPMIDSLTNSNEMASIFLAKQSSVGALTVFNPVPLETGWKMNDASLVPRLVDLASMHQSEFNKQFGEWLDRT